jgi:hypothetical protein
MTITEKSEKKMLSQIKGENRTGLKVVVGPDKRMRLVLDRSLSNRSSSDGSPQNYITPAYLARGEMESHAYDGMLDGQGDDFDF